MPAQLHQHVAVRQVLHGARPQPKLTVGAPDDVFEREADQVADQVMRMPEPSVAAASAAPRVQRMCAECEQEREERVQAKEEAGQTPEVPSGFAQRFAALHGGGQTLPDTERSFFEPRFGRDFADVRLHSGPAADALARSVHARAFTLGDSIVFGSGQYSPGSNTGRQLLAHELTHVVQQGGDREAPPSAAGPVQRQGEQDNRAIQLSDIPSISPVLQRQPAPAPPPPAGAPCTQQPAINAARKEAALRVNAALWRVTGVAIPGREGVGQTPADQQALTRRTVETVFGGWADMDAVADTLARMRNWLLRDDLPVMCASGDDRRCGERAGFVAGLAPPIMLCPRFFAKDPFEQQVRTMVHESAHLTGIGEIEGESYCTSYDCAGSCGGRNVADSWAHLVNCLSGQIPDPAAARLQGTVTGPPPAARLYVLNSEGPIFGINSGRSGLEQALTFVKIQFSAGFSWLQPPGGRVFFIQNILSSDDSVETCGRCCHFTSGPGVDEEKYYGAGEVLVGGRRQEIKFVKLPTPANPGTFNLFFLRTSDTPTMPVDSVFCGSPGTQFPDGTTLKVGTTQRFRMFAAWEPSEAGPVTPLASVDWGFRTCKTMVKDQPGKTGSDAWTEKADCGTAMLPQQSKSDPPASELLLNPVLHAADLQQKLESSCAPCAR
jgi:hypothetical protein